MIKKFKTRLENKQSIEKKRKVYSKKVRSNKKVIKTKINKKTIGGALIDEEKDMKELKKLLFKMYPKDGEHLSSKTIEELQLKNVNDLMYLTRESIDDFIKNKLNKEDENYQSQIRECLLFLSKKLKKELSMLKKRLEKKFSEYISNKIIDELGLRNVNDLINAKKNEIESYEEEIGITGITDLLLLRKELKKRQGLLKARLKKMFSGNISIIIRELKLTDIYGLSKLKRDDMIYLYKRLNHTDEIKRKIFKLPEMLSDNYQMLMNELLRHSSFSRDEMKMIIRELMLFEISDLAFVSIKEIDNLSLTDEKKKGVYSFHIEEFNKFMLKKMFNDTTTKIEAKNNIINYITLKLPDIYQLMKADDSKIKAIDLGNLTVSIQKKLKDLQVSLLQDSLLPDSRIKTNRIKSNSRSNSSSNSRSNSSSSS